VLFHFDFRTWARMLRLAWREKNPRNRRALFFTLLVTVPLVSCFHAICFFLDGILFPSLWRTQVVKPVFIVGHARSGTTLLHRLMSRDERFSAFLLYELFLPSLIQKKVVRAVARLDARWLGGALERRVRAWEEKKFGPTQHIHPQSLTEPEEDDAVLTFSCASGSWIVRLPYMGELDFYYVDRWPEKRRRRLMRFYKECVRRQLHLNGPHKHHLSKNPTFAGRVETLIEIFPDARFVLPYRNPYEAVASLLKLMQVSWRMRKWSDAEMQSSLRYLANQSYDTYKVPLEVLARHPEVPRAIVDYTELVAEPRKVIERIYAEIGFPVSPEYAETLEAAQRRAEKAHETAHRYSLEEFGLRAEEFRANLGELFERFHWDEEPKGEEA
jgi:hypothetical protein